MPRIDAKPHGMAEESQRFHRWAVMCFPRFSPLKACVSLERARSSFEKRKTPTTKAFALSVGVISFRPNRPKRFRGELHRLIWLSPYAIILLVSVIPAASFIGLASRWLWIASFASSFLPRLAASPGSSLHVIRPPRSVVGPHGSERDCIPLAQEFLAG
jgi:hypothetical protein